MAECNITISLKFDLLLGCDGKPHSTEFLTYLLEKSIKEERYEDAVIYDKELKRRKCSLAL